MKTNTVSVPSRVTPWHVVGGIIILAALFLSFVVGISISRILGEYSEMMSYLGGSYSSSGGDGGTIAVIVIVINLVGWTIGLIQIGIGEIIYHAKARNGYLMILAKVPDVTKYKVTYKLAEDDEE